MGKERKRNEILEVEVIDNILLIAKQNRRMLGTISQVELGIYGAIASWHCVNFCLSSDLEWRCIYEETCQVHHWRPFIRSRRKVKNEAIYSIIDAAERRYLDTLFSMITHERNLTNNGSKYLKSLFRQWVDQSDWTSWQLEIVTWYLLRFLSHVIGISQSDLDEIIIQAKKTSGLRLKNYLVADAISIAATGELFWPVDLIQKK